MSQKDSHLKSSVPILRMIDEHIAKEFYIDFLEFTVDWEHRFEEDFPLYMQISSGNCIIHLSEHHGDSNLGMAIRIEVGNIKALHEKLLSKKYKFARPGLEKKPWNTLEISISDPFKNQIIFYENIADESFSRAD